MTPRDLTNRRAIVVSSSAIETMDVSEYLEARGWGTPVVLGSTKEAMGLLQSDSAQVDLVVLAGSQSDPVAEQIIRTCVERRRPIVVIDGARSSAYADRIATVARPFTDADLDDALARLARITR